LRRRNFALAEDHICASAVGDRHSQCTCLPVDEGAPREQQIRSLQDEGFRVRRLLIDVQQRSAVGRPHLLLCEIDTEDRSDIELRHELLAVAFGRKTVMSLTCRAFERHGAIELHRAGSGNDGRDEEWQYAAHGDHVRVPATSVGSTR
jgi:hypothetical protein